MWILLIVILLKINGEIVDYHNIDDASISSGIEHTCAIHFLTNTDFGGQVNCWGSNSYGQCNAPKGTFIQLSSGRFHTCGIKMDETVACWGHAGAGTSPLGLYTQISSGDFHACGVLKDETVKCWGQNYYGEGTAPLGKYVQVSAGKGHTCGLLTDGNAVCWGNNDKGQCNVPEDVQFVQLSAAPGDFTCGVTADRNALCFGDNSFKQINAPVNELFDQVSTSKLSACGIKQDKTIVCWGMKGAVTAVPKDIRMEELTLSGNHGCAIHADSGKVVCWGYPDGNLLDIPKNMAVIQ